MQTIIYDVLYYAYILFFGTYVSIRLACGCVAAKEWKSVLCLGLALLMAQGMTLQMWGIDMVWKLYPAIVHLPITLTIIFVLKAKWDVALISVMIAYSLCQPLRWIGLVLDELGIYRGVSLLFHLCLCQLFLALFDKFCAQSIHHLIERSAPVRRWFGALPVLYYIYEYFMMYMHDQLADFLPINELLPTAMILFFIMFSIVYHRQSEKRDAYERQALMFEAELSQAANEIRLLRVIEEKTAIHRHDLRHHLTQHLPCTADQRPHRGDASLFLIFPR